MARYASEPVILNELEQWTTEAGAPLPLPMAEMVWAERCGLVVDLCTGERVFPVDDWADFSERWFWEMVRRGVRPEAVRLAAAIQRANDYGWDGQLCRAAAHVMLDRVMKRICTAQAA